MAFAIKRRTHLNGTNFEPFFYPAFFLLQLNLIYMKRILHLVPVKIIIFNFSYSWIRILRLVRPLTIRAKKIGKN